MTERAPLQRRQGWLYPTLGAMALVLFGIGVGRIAFGGARPASSSAKSASKDLEASEPRPPAQTLNVVNRTDIDPDVLREQVTIAVGKALDAREAASATTAAAAADAAARRPLSAKNIEAFDAAQAVLAKGTAAHRWSRAYRRELHTALSGATREQRMEIETELLKRLNSGEIQYDPEAE